jgi:ABC-type Mn2+/Zn2+ transport system permease subunit
MSINTLTGRQLTHTLPAFLTVSSVTSILSAVIGFSIYRYYPTLKAGAAPLNLALGPAIISVATLFFLLSLLRRKT